MINSYTGIIINWFDFIIIIKLVEFIIVRFILLGLLYYRFLLLTWLILIILRSLILLHKFKFWLGRLLLLLRKLLLLYGFTLVREFFLFLISIILFLLLLLVTELSQLRWRVRLKVSLLSLIRFKIKSFWNFVSLIFVRRGRIVNNLLNIFNILLFLLIEGITLSLLILL